MKRYIVTAPYVTLRVPSPAGPPVLGGYYKDAVPPENAVAEDLERLAGKGMLEELKAPVPAVEPDADAGLPPQRPADNANKPAWVDYAVAMRPEGVSEEDARAEAEATKKDDLIARFPAE